MTARRWHRDDPETRDGAGTDGLPLFHRHGPDTERQAARKVQSTAARLRGSVLELVRQAGADGVTADEAIVALAPALDYSVRPRFSELRDAGLIRDSGRRRANQRQNPEIVWTLIHPEGAVS